MLFAPLPSPACSPGRWRRSRDRVRRSARRSRRRPAAGRGRTGPRSARVEPPQHQLTSRDHGQRAPHPGTPRPAVRSRRAASAVTTLGPDQASISQAVVVGGQAEGDAGEPGDEGQQRDDAAAGGERRRVTAAKAGRRNRPRSIMAWSERRSTTTKAASRTTPAASRARTSGRVQPSRPSVRPASSALVPSASSTTPGTSRRARWAASTRGSPRAGRERHAGHGEHGVHVTPGVPATEPGRQDGADGDPGAHAGAPEAGGSSALERVGERGAIIPSPAATTAAPPMPCTMRASTKTSTSGATRGHRSRPRARASRRRTSGAARSRRRRGRRSAGTRPGRCSSS